MGQLDLSKAQSSDYANSVDDVEVDSMNTDGVGNQDETKWTNTKWSTYWGYFNQISDLKSALLMKAIWNVGKGFSVDAQTEVILDHVKGWGKDTFQDILFNLEVTRRIGGDAYAEIIRADDAEKTILNIKPLDPGSISIIVDRKGMIKRYEQNTKLPNNKESVIKFKPEEILHLSNNRLADQIHGISDIESLEETIKADNESFVDIKKLMHHQAKPFILWKLKTDDQVKIQEIVAKIDSARNLGEDMFIPDDDATISYEIVQLNPSNIILEWRNDTRNKFFRAIGLPQIVPGAGGQSTESESKVIYLAFEQIVEKDQRYIEKQLWKQLGIKLDLYPPASMQPDMATDTMKDGSGAPQASDTTAGVGR